MAYIPAIVVSVGEPKDGKNGKFCCVHCIDGSSEHFFPLFSLEDKEGNARDITPYFYKKPIEEDSEQHTWTTLHIYNGKQNDKGEYTGIKCYLATLSQIPVRF